MMIWFTVEDRKQRN